MKLRLLASSALCFSLLLTGCSSNETKSTSKTEEKKEETKLIGKKVSGDHVLKVKLKNETGKKIKSFSMNGSDNMIDDTYKTNETRTLYYDLTDVESVVVSITFDDDTTKEMKCFPLENCDKASLKLEDDVLFVTYKSTKDKSEVSTKDDEIASNTTTENTEETSEEAQSASTESTQAESSTQYSAPTQETQSSTNVETNNTTPVTPSVPDSSSTNTDSGCIGEDPDTY